MHGALGAGVDRVEHEVHRRGREGSVGRVTGNVGLVDLHALGREALDLSGEHLAECHREPVEIAVMVI
ncbi:MAG: hypothetical protein RLZZ221_2338, partial [Verrucomicrobiota bacterium]